MMVFLRKSSDSRSAALLARIRSGFLMFAVTGGIGDCSVSMPLPGFIDNDTTGSLKPRAAAANPYDPGDWKKAEPAVASALKSGEAADPADWSNPDTGRKGQVAAVAAPFKRDGSVCRALIGRIQEGETIREWQGVGCRGEGERVVLEDVSPWRGL